jgi:hypothetical protein
MTEAEWLACEDPGPMLDFLRGKVSDRKLRLFACACCRKLFHPFQGERHRRAVALAEEFAGGRLSADEHDRAQEEWGRIDRRWLSGRERCEVEAIWGALLLSAADGAKEASRAVAATGTALGGLLRCLVGPVPFRPLPRLNPAWLAWEGGMVARMAQVAYDARAFDRLPILADALEEAGCDAAEVLTHLRGPGPHVRGCWAVDLVLGEG